MAKLTLVLVKGKAPLQNEFTFESCNCIDFMSKVAFHLSLVRPNIEYCFTSNIKNQLQNQTLATEASAVLLDTG